MSNNVIPPYSVNDQGWTFFVDNRPICVPANSPIYADIMDAVTENDYDTLMDLLSENKVQTAFKKLVFADKSGNFKILENESTGDKSISYTDDSGKTHILPDVLTNKLTALHDKRIDMERYVNFVRNVYLNPNPDSIAELFDFLSYKELPITQNGTFIAYKGVREDLYSVNANKQTRVLSGVVDDYGHIKNSLNTKIAVHTEDVDPDRRNECSNGLHVGSYDYASQWGSVVLAVEVNPRYVISVPMDCSFQKCRVSQYKVLTVVDGVYDNSSLEVDNDTGEIDAKEESIVTSGLDAAVNEMLSAANITNTRAAIDRNIDNHCVLNMVLSDGAKRVNVYPSDATDNEIIDKDPIMNSATNVEYINIFRAATTISQLVGSVGRKNNINRASMLTLLIKLGYDVDLDNVNVGNSIVR